MQKLLNILSRLNKTHRPFFYRDKRVLLSFMLSLPITYFFGLFAGVLAHLASGVFWDIWFFSYRGVKESDVVSQEWLTYTGMTREQLDHHSQVFMWLRHGAFGVCAIVLVADFFLKFGFAYAFTFLATYFLFRFVSGFFLAFKNMIYPWIGAKTQMEGRNSSENFDPLYFAKKNEYTGPSINDLYNSSNPGGYYNPISPNYIFRER